MILLGLVALPTGVIMFLVNLVGHWVPRSVPIGATVAFVVFAAWGRATWKRLLERDFDVATPRQHAGGHRRRGEGGYDLIRSMLTTPSGGGTRSASSTTTRSSVTGGSRGVPVLGTTRPARGGGAHTDADSVVVAIPSAHAAFVRRVSQQASAVGVDAKVLPPTAGLLSGSRRASATSATSTSLTSWVGTSSTPTSTSIAQLPARASASWSPAPAAPSAPCCAARSTRSTPRGSICSTVTSRPCTPCSCPSSGRALLDSDDVVLCDIRDASAVRDVFATPEPEVVFHAAALKHLPMLEQYPRRSGQDQHPRHAQRPRGCRRLEVERFVNVSTDKAADPTQRPRLLQAHRREAHRQYAARRRAPTSSVRFGNVLGSHAARC